MFFRIWECNSKRMRNMHFPVNIASVAIVLIPLIVHSCAAANSSAPTYYHGLLSDVLEIYNNEHNLSITPLCGQHLESIQMGINVKEIWAMKREYSFTSACSLMLCNYRWKCQTYNHCGIPMWKCSSYYTTKFWFELHAIFLDWTHCVCNSLAQWICIKQSADTTFSVKLWSQSNELKKHHLMSLETNIFNFFGVFVAVFG